jgi:hypothetical protein
MLKKVLFILFIVILNQNINALELNYSQNGVATLSTLGSPYQILQNLTIPENKTLTIEPGVQMLFDPMVEFVVKGRLIAIGNETQRISLAPLRSSFNTDRASNYSFWSNLRFTNQNGLPNGKLEIFSTGYNRWLEVCLKERDKQTLQVFLNLTCLNFGYRYGQIRKNYLIDASSDNYFWLAENCNPKQANSILS